MVRQEVHLMQYPKAWGTVGGPLIPGESMEQTMVRKLENVGIKLAVSKGQVLYQQTPCEVVLFFLYECVYPVRLELGLPSMQQLHVFHHIQLPVNARSLRLTTKSEVDIALWLSEGQIREITSGVQGTVEGVWKGNKSCRVSYVQISGAAPNVVGEGWASSSQTALEHWLSHGRALL